MSGRKIETIPAEQLCKMRDGEGLVLQGCGGDPQEWPDGINSLLTEAGILKDGSEFQHIYVFEHDGLTNILFPFEGTELDAGRLAMWRLQTHSQSNGTRLSDYLPRRAIILLGPQQALVGGASLLRQARAVPFQILQAVIKETAVLSGATTGGICCQCVQRRRLLGNVIVSQQIQKGGLIGVKQIVQIHIPNFRGVSRPFSKAACAT